MTKGSYLDTGDTTGKAEKWLEELPYRRQWPGRIEAKKSVLLVIDMQRHFLDPESYAYLPTGENIIEKIHGLIELFHEIGGKIIYTKTVQSPDEKGTMLQWWSSLMTEGPMTELDPRITVKGEVITKPTYSSFHRTDMEEHLEGIENVFICGVMTDICCETACRDAFVRDHRTFFIADATATTSEEVHLSSLKSICHGLGEIILCKNVKQRLRS